MKANACLSSLLSLLCPLLTSAQDTPAAPPVTQPADATALASEIEARRPVRKELPQAVRAARVEAQVTVPGAAGGAPLTISRIEPPVLPAPEAPRRTVTAFTDEQRAAIRAAAPLRSLLFSPTITVYPGGVSLVNWGHVEPGKSYQAYEAWLPWDLSSIAVVGDFEVGRTRYSLMGFAHPAAGRALAREVPAPATIKEGYQLTKGDPGNAAALEPLRALTAVYKAEAPQLAATHAAQQERQRAWEAWEKQNPEPPRPAEIRFWKITPAHADKATSSTDAAAAK